MLKSAIYKYIPIAIYKYAIDIRSAITIWLLIKKKHYFSKYNILLNSHEVEE